MPTRISMLQGLALVVLIVGISIGIGLSADRTAETPLDRSLGNWATAHARWDQAHLDDYRVLMQRMHVMGGCMQEVDVSSGKIKRAIRNECEASPMTVNGYFEHMRQQILNSRCPDTSCKCTVVYRVDMTFAASDGHPRSIQLVADSFEANANSDDYWQRQALGLDPLECTAAMVFATSPGTILDITPR